MENEEPKPKRSPKVKAPLYDHEQAIALFKLDNRLQFVMKKKFSGKQLTMKQWEEFLKQEKIID